MLLGASLVVVRAGVCKISFLSDSTLQVHGGQVERGSKVTIVFGVRLADFSAFNGTLTSRFDPVRLDCPRDSF